MKKVNIRTLKDNAELLMLCLPGIIFLIIFAYWPMFGIILAFKNFNYDGGFLGSPWCGFDNFKFLFQTEDAFIITRNTIGYNLIFIFVGAALAVTLAISLNEIRHKKLAKTYQTVAIMPNFLSWVAVSFIFFAFLSIEPTGYANRIREAFGNEAVNWYTEAKYWPYILVVANMWKNVGFGSVVYLAAITGISPEYHEAAAIDGASKWQQIKHITLPFLKPTIIILLILNIGKIFYSDFGLFYQLSRDSGQLYSVTNTIDYYVYNALMNMGNISMSSAAGVYQSLVGFILVVTTNIIVKKADSDYALF